MAAINQDRTIGWIGAGRMGAALVTRLLDAGCDVAVFNRTRAKAEPLIELGAKVVESPADLADREIVFTIVGGDSDLTDVTLGEAGVLSRPDVHPKILIDSTTVSGEASGRVRERCDSLGVAFLSAPVSGNPKVVKAGKLTFVVSGPRAAFEETHGYFDVLGAGCSYVGEGENARVAKICHNLMLGVVTQTLAEITVLAEKAGIGRAAFLDFFNKSVMGSTFTRYKTPAFVNLDMSPTFTPVLLRKDFDLGLKAGRELDVPMPVVALTREIVQSLIGKGLTDVDFAVLLEQQALNSALDLQPEDVEVSDGLEAEGS
jgi:3-hydroxyisobutyrate dehydrogenase-like beta-hydroxyacid dehydrogenase